MADRRNLAPDLREQIIRLSPWSLDVQVTPDLRTGIVSPELSQADAGLFAGAQATLRSPKEDFCGLLRRAFPGGLQGRTVLDCGCGCGGYLFWAKELGAGDCLGFDVQKHCIDQALFLTRNRIPRCDGIKFQVLDLRDLGRLQPPRFDLTLFNGVFNHLPDPVTGLKIAAGFTREMLIVEPATRNGYADGMLALHKENRTHLASAYCDALGWLPTGPLAVARILEWLGFIETRCVWQKPEEHGPDKGRLCLIASRSKEALAAFDSWKADASDKAKKPRRLWR